MPCYYKIGCTERAPSARAQELSASTSVPAPFRVLLYFETEHFQFREQRLHGHLGDFRPNRSREFFIFGPNHLPWVYALFKHYPNKLGFTECYWEGDIEQAMTYPDPWAEDPDAPDGLWLDMPNFSPIQFGELRLIA
jgi:hypothetical protein